MATEWVWAFVVNSVGGPEVRGSSDPVPLVQTSASGNYTVTFPGKRLERCGALGTLNSSAGLITVIPASSTGGALRDDQVNVFTMDRSGLFVGSVDFTVAVPCAMKQSPGGAPPPPPSSAPVSPRVRAFASVRSDGTVRRSFPPASVSHLGPGLYNVWFNALGAVIHECSIVATISTASSAEGRGRASDGEISVSTTDGPGAIGFFVFTYNSSGPLGFGPAQSDRGFDVVLVSP
jgi:hypothetical protein